MVALLFNAPLLDRIGTWSALALALQCLCVNTLEQPPIAIHNFSSTVHTGTAHQGVVVAPVIDKGLTALSFY